MPAIGRLKFWSQHWKLVDRKTIAVAYRLACRLDVLSIKPGNVSIYRSHKNMEAPDFIVSADVTALILTDNTEDRLGEIIAKAAEATDKAVGKNTNLGIILMCTPLARAGLKCTSEKALHNLLLKILENGTVEDTQGVFDAIAVLNPGGLGESEQHDAKQKAEAALLEVMDYASDRDMLAKQYSSGYEDIFEFGKESCLRAASEMESADDADWLSVSGIFLDFLATFPDSHIARKHGAYMAEVVRDEALRQREIFHRCDPAVERRQHLLRWHDQLMVQGLNPGTTADLTVATLFLGMLTGWMDINAVYRAVMSSEDKLRCIQFDWQGVSDKSDLDKSR